MAFAQRLTNRLQQGRWRHGLGQHGLQHHPPLAGAHHRIVTPVSRCHDDGGHGVELLVAQLAHGFHPVHAGHFPVHQHQLVRAGGFVCRRDQPQGFGAVPCHVHVQPEGLGHAGQNLARRGVVVHQQHAHALQFVGPEHAPHLGLGLNTKAGLEMEGRAHARHALDPDAPAHGLHQALGDGQAQTRAAVLSRGGRVGLGEALEQLGALLRGHANACVAHPEVQVYSALVLTHLGHANDDLAAVRELGGIAAQVDQHLAQPQWVADQGGGHIGGRVKQQLEAFVLGLQAEHAGQVLQHIVQMEIDCLQAHLAGFNFGEVQDVVDDAQQDFTRAAHFFNVVALVLVQVGLQHQVAHANDGVHGRADLMAHVGQEIALAAVGRLRQRMRLLDFFDGRPLQRNVLHDTDQILRNLARLHGSRGQACPEMGAILAHQFALRYVNLAQVSAAVYLFASFHVGRFCGVPHAYIAADLRPRRIAHHFVQHPVAAQNGPVAHQDNAHAGGFKQGALLAQRRPQLLSAQGHQLFQVLAMALQLIAHALLLGDVFLDGEIVGNAAARLVNGRNGGELHVLAAILAAVDQLAPPDLATGQRSPHGVMGRLGRMA